ncbi:MAG: hypothetical protein PUJ72_03755 [Eubacteriales bacterium]|nr:hypothetical protein [Eubacteriales bacterium]
MNRLIRSIKAGIHSKHRGYVLATCIVMMAVILIICSTLIAVSGIESKTVKLRQVMLEQDIMAKDIAIEFVKGNLSSDGELNGYSFKIVSDENTEPENPAPENPAPENPEPGTPEPKNPEPGTPDPENPIKSWTETITISRNEEPVLVVSVKVTEKDGNKTRIVTSWTNGSVI